MKALTVRQPWAHLILTGVKRIENRSWETSHRGQLLIHAAKSPDNAARDLLEEFSIDPADLAYGAIIGIVTVTDCIELANLTDDLADDPFAGGPFCWLLADAKPLAPIPWKGALGLWEFPAARLKVGTP